MKRKRKIKEQVKEKNQKKKKKEEKEKKKRKKCVFGLNFVVQHKFFLKFFLVFLVFLYDYFQPFRLIVWPKTNTRLQTIIKYQKKKKIIEDE